MIKKFESFLVGECKPISYEDFANERDKNGWHREDFTGAEGDRILKVARISLRSPTINIMSSKNQIIISDGDITSGRYLDLSIYKYVDEWYLLKAVGRPHTSNTFYLCDGFETLCHFIENSGWRNKKRG